MYLRKLEINGFKSFAKKSTLEFTSPISGIVGPNGSGKCVDGSTLVQLSSGEITSIRELYERAEKTAHMARLFNDGNAIIASDYTCNVGAVNLVTQKMEWMPVTAFVKRTAPTEMLSITTRSGRTIKATPYHPFFVNENCEMKALKAEDVKVGARIAVPRSIFVRGTQQNISMLDVARTFKDEDGVYIPYSSTLEEIMDKEMVHRGFVTTAALSRSFGLEETVLRRVRDEQALPIKHLSHFVRSDNDLSFRYIKSHGKKNLRVPESVSEEFARFLGYVISEGRVTSAAQVWFVNEDIEMVNDFNECVKKCFDVEAKVFSYKGDTKDVIVFSRPLTLLLDRMFGMTIDGHSRTKKVPDQIFKSPDSIVAAFLSALFDGDGHFCFKKGAKTKTGHKSSVYAEYASASEELARGVSSLLLRFGITSVIRSKQKWASNSPVRKKKTYWSLFVYGGENVRLFAQVLNLKGRKRIILNDIKRMIGRSENPNYDLVPGVLDELRDLIKEAKISVKKVRKEIPLLAAYYEKRCLPSRTGIRKVVDFIQKHSLLSPRVQELLLSLQRVASSDVLWDEIVSVERYKSDGYVYDLAVAGHHNFIANNIFAHNSNVAEAFRFVLGEQSIKSLRGKKGEDLIFNGANDSARMNRASVKVVFDNTKRVLNLDFDEVTIERVVHRDSSNEYLINGSQVRLKDIIEILAGAHIGASGHHIISQGEADKILNANIKERREMIEDALGLKIYQFKKQESIRKLEKTEENIKSVESLRREIAPHLKFLKKQVEKVEKVFEMRRTLVALYKEYFKREELYLKFERGRIENEKAGPLRELKQLDAELAEAKEILSTSQGKDEKSEAIISIESRLKIVRHERDTITRESGRIEGEVYSLERLIKKEKERQASEADKMVYMRDVEDLVKRVDVEIGIAEAKDSLFDIKTTLQNIRELVFGFVQKNRTVDGGSVIHDVLHDIEKLKVEKVRFEDRLIELQLAEGKLNEEYAQVKDAVEKEKDSNRDAEKKVFRIMAVQNEIRGKLSALKNVEDKLGIEEEAFKRELTEAHVLAGREALDFRAHEILNKNGYPMTPDEIVTSEPRAAQDERRKQLEKIKIRIEDSGGGNSEDIMKEYKEVEQRDQFLEKELSDLFVSAKSIRELIMELDIRLDQEFKEGILKINAQFQEFFALMFGGGTAALTIVREKKKKKADTDIASLMNENDGGEMVEEEEVGTEGVDISVMLPRKKIKGLVMLSGGERALTSIALLFAVSQVNPPPFIILDETDAALDEANSRKYGEMISNLSQYSQLILITHNRETMSRAGVLYGVTMGSDGGSRLLSIAFDEAVKVAK